MNPTTAQQLIELNRQFYQTFGGEFSATRGRIQPGVRRIINEMVAKDERILDLGCGNGNFAFALADEGFAGTYLGLDFSIPLLENAAPLAGDPRFRFEAIDLTAPLLSSPHFRLNFAENGGSEGGFSLITSFATLHHIPSDALRLNIFRFVRSKLVPGGKFVLSNWQFLNSEKLKKRIQPWKSAGLSAADVDAGDYLLDWRSGGSGLRYAHHFSADELGRLASDTGFRAVDSFLSDGESGNLGLYQIWEAG